MESFTRERFGGGGTKSGAVQLGLKGLALERRYTRLAPLRAMITHSEPGSVPSSTEMDREIRFQENSDVDSPTVR